MDSQFTAAWGCWHVDLNNAAVQWGWTVETRPKPSFQISLTCQLKFSHLLTVSYWIKTVCCRSKNHLHWTAPVYPLYSAGPKSGGHWHPTPPGCAAHEYTPPSRTLLSCRIWLVWELWRRYAWRIWPLASRLSRSLKVIELTRFDPPLMTFHSNHGSISYSLRDKSRFLSKILIFLTHVYLMGIGYRRSGLKKTRMMGLPGRERSLTSRLDTIYERDRRPDGRTNFACG